MVNVHTTRCEFICFGEGCNPTLFPNASDKFHLFVFLRIDSMRKLLLLIHGREHKESTESRLTNTEETRQPTGTDAQAEIFGGHMKEFWKGGLVNYWLASNCFGDYYTRKGLNLKEREMITFCFLLAQGGCESQLRGHIQGNINMGNDAEFLTKVVQQMIPYIGYPRSLNALACLSEFKK